MKAKVSGPHSCAAAGPGMLKAPVSRLLLTSPSFTLHAGLLLWEGGFRAVNIRVAEPSLRQQRPDVRRCAEGKGLELGPGSTYPRKLPFFSERLEKSELLRSLGQREGARLPSHLH